MKTGGTPEKEEGGGWGVRVAEVILSPRRDIKNGGDPWKGKRVWLGGGCHRSMWSAGVTPPEKGYKKQGGPLERGKSLGLGVLPKSLYPREEI